ncbi:MAG: UvrD-helicase domain-containing protein [Geitlerinemataceae cyanobacterium]
MGLTPQQARAALAPGSVAVTAGAGTGKTFVLAERYLYYLRDRDCSPLEVVAATFTEKAAQELKSRIRSFVRAQHPDRLDWLAELEAAPICTLHSLAKRVCEEHPDRAGVPASFSIIDDIEAPTWMDEQLCEALANLPDEIYDAIPYSQLEAAIARLLGDPISVGQAFDRLPADWEADWGALVEEMRDRELSKLLDDPGWADCYFVLNNTCGKAGDKLEEARLNGLTAMMAIEDRREIQGYLEAIKSINLRGGSKKNWPPGDVERVKAELKTLKALTKKPLEKGSLTVELGEADRALAAKLPVLRRAFELVREHFRKAKHRQRILTFDDLEVGAIAALEHAEVRAYYRDRFRAFLVDEFQDTNPVQAQIVNALTGLGNPTEEPASLTVVGDVKQSIYSFRRADVRVFLDFSDRIVAGGGDRVEMSLCFRTHAPLIDGINKIFRPLLEDIHQDLDAARTVAPDDAPPVEVYALDPPNGITAEERRRAEGRKIAEWIDRAVQEQWPVADRKSGQPRPMQYGDIAILGRAWAVLQLYGDVLEECGLPVSIVGGDSLLDTREAKDVLMLLRWLADEADDLALVALLRSPFFAVSDRTLAQIARDTAELTDDRPVPPPRFSEDNAGGEPEEEPPEKPRRAIWWQRICAWDWSQDPDFFGDSAGGLATPVETLTELRDRRDDPSRRTQIADRLTGYTAAIGNLPGAARRLADWRGMLELIAKLEAKDRSLFGVVRQLDRAIDSEVKIPRLPLEADNAISLMTIHKSKGLEWPVVFVANLNAGDTPDRDNLKFDPEWGVAFTWEDEISGEKQTPILFRAIAESQQRANDAEVLRLLYVALTRARDRLILTANQAEKGHLERLRPGLEFADIPLKPWEYDESDAAIEPPPPPRDTTRDRPLLLEPIAWTPTELPARALRDYHRCPQLFAFRYRDGHPGLDARSRQRDRLLAIVARLLETGERSGDAPPRLQRQADALVDRFDRLKAFASYRDADRQGRTVRTELGGISFYGKLDLIADRWSGILTLDEIEPTTQAIEFVEAWVYGHAIAPDADWVAIDLATKRAVTATALERAALEPVVADIVAKIRAGDFAPTSSSCACAGCTYADLCRDRPASLPNHARIPPTQRPPTVPQAARAAGRSDAL